jgi:hypothetical protein
MSEVVDIQEVIDANSNLEALDFYHKLTDSSGNVTHVRFRYYDKELPALANSLKQYPQAKTWKDVVGLQEDVTVAPKPSGSYMHITARTASSSNVSQISSGASSTNSHPPKRGGLSSRLSNRGKKPVQTVRQALISEDEGDEVDDFFDEADE